MASFTDAISQFNPYVAQLPVDAMAKVGMQKQAQYEQGVQKIQAYIDNIAGMDVAHDADKAYLQSKMNALGNNLKVVAGGDFSNQQLVNSVGGMATQIVKDPNIQNAVSSTAWYKKQKQQLDADYQAGKSSIANVKDFERQANAWLSNNQVGQTFRGRYSPYIDLDKKWRDIIKTINPSANSEDFIYEDYVGKDGRVKTQQLANVMSRITKEGVSAETIENVLRTSLSPDDLNQLRIDAAYRFEGVGPDQLKAIATSNYDSSIKYLDKVSSSLQGLATLSSSNPDQKRQALQALNQIEAKKLELKKNLQNSLSLADSNPEAAKTNLYKEGYIDQFAKSFSWEKKALQLLDNPGLSAQFRREDIDLRKAEFAQRKIMDSWKVTVDKFDMADKTRKFELDVEKLYGKGGAFTAYLGPATDKLLNPNDLTNKQIVDLKEQEDLGIQKLAKNIGISEGALRTSLASYQIDPKVIPAQWRGDAINILETRKQAMLKQAQLDVATAEALDSPLLRAKNEQLNKDIDSKKPFTLNVNGVVHTFSQREIYDMLSKEREVTIPGKGNRSITTTVIDPETLSNKGRILYNYLKGVRYEGTGNTPNSTQQAVLSRLKEYSPLIARNKQIQEDINDRINNSLMQSSGTYAPAYSAIITPTAESRALYEGIADGALKTYSFDALGIKGGSAKLSQDDIVTAKGWLSGEEKGEVKYGKLKYGGETFLAMSKGTKEILIPLPAIQAAQLPKLKGEENELSEEIARYQKSNSKLSTNPDNDVHKSWYQAYDMPMLKNTIATADLQMRSGSPGTSYINLNIKSPIGFLPLQLDDYPMPNSAADSFIRGLTDAKIREIYLNNPGVPQSWKDAIKNL